MEKNKNNTKYKNQKLDTCKAEADHVKAMMLLNAIHENDQREKDRNSLDNQH